MIARDERGFTLVELLVSILIAGVIAAALTTVINQISTITAEGNAELATQVGLQKAAVWLNRDAMESDCVELITDTQIVLTKYESLNEEDHTTAAARTITYTISGRELIREDSAGTSRAIANDVECVRFSIHGGEEVVTNVVRGGKVRAVVASHSHLPGTERRSAIMNMDMRADGPLEIPASYTATIPASEIITSDDFGSNDWYGGEGWAGDHWGHEGDVEVDSGHARLGGSDDRHRRTCLFSGSSEWGDSAYMVRQADIPDCTTDLTIQLHAKVENFQGDDEMRLLASPDGTNWETVQTWSENTDGYQLYEIPVHEGGTVCDLWIKFDADMLCPGDWGNWHCCAIFCFCWCEDWVCDQPGESNFYIDDLVIKGR